MRQKNTEKYGKPANPRHLRNRNCRLIQPNVDKYSKIPPTAVKGNVMPKNPKISERFSVTFRKELGHLNAT